MVTKVMVTADGSMSAPQTMPCTAADNADMAKLAQDYAANNTPAAQAKRELVLLDEFFPRILEDLVSKTLSLPLPSSDARNVMNRKEQLRAIIRGTTNGKSLNQRALDAMLNTLTAEVDASGAAFTALAALAAHGVSVATANTATNAPTDSKNDYNVVTTVLGTLVDGLNTTNRKQNQIATNLNALAVAYNDLATKFNALLGKIAEEREAINSLKAAGAKLDI